MHNVMNNSKQQQIQQNLQKAESNGFITDTSVLSYLLLSAFRYGTKKKILMKEFASLKRMISERGFPLANEFADEKSLDEALSLLKNFLAPSRNFDFIQCSSSLVLTLDLSFYANQVFHVFWSESLLVLSILSLFTLPGSFLFEQ